MDSYKELYNSPEGKYIKWLEKDLPHVIADMAAKYEPVSKRDIGGMSKKIESDIKGVIDTYINRMHADTMQENAKLDTKSEYVRLNREIIKCYK